MFGENKPIATTVIKNIHIHIPTTQLVFQQKKVPPNLRFFKPVGCQDSGFTTSICAMTLPIF